MSKLRFFAPKLKRVVDRPAAAIDAARTAREDDSFALPVPHGRLHPCLILRREFRARALRTGIVSPATEGSIFYSLCTEVTLRLCGVSHACR